MEWLRGREIRDEPVDDETTSWMDGWMLGNVGVAREGRRLLTAAARNKARNPLEIKAIKVATGQAGRLAGRRIQHGSPHVVRQG